MPEIPGIAFSGREPPGLRKRPGFILFNCYKRGPGRWPGCLHYVTEIWHGYAIGFVINFGRDTSVFAGLKNLLQSTKSLFNQEHGLTSIGYEKKMPKEKLTTIPLLITWCNVRDSTCLDIFTVELRTFSVSLC